MANLADVLRKIGELPPDKLEDVAHYLEAISSTAQNDARDAETRRSFSDGPYFGMWADRPEMDDSAQWVRELRENEWSRYHTDDSQ